MPNILPKISFLTFGFCTFFRTFNPQKVKKTVTFCPVAAAPFASTKVAKALSKSSLKRIRQEETRRLHNRYYGKTMRNAVRKLRATTDKAAATAMYPGITKLLDKLAKTNVIHKNKANNLKSKLAIYINKLV